MFSDDDFTNLKDDTIAMITFWSHQPKQFPKMGTRERLPTEGIEGTENKANFKDSKCFYFQSLPSILVPIVSIRMGWGPTLSADVRVRYPAVELC